MDYELCKKLKDARFPNSEDWKKGRLFGIGVCMVRDLGEDLILVPTLSELIEACEWHFHSLHQAEGLYGTVWIATVAWDSRKMLTGDHFREGKTPEEAVARLWLALNK